MSEEEKSAVLRQRIVFWTNALAESIRREMVTPDDVVPELFENWTLQERKRFNEDWGNNEGLCQDWSQGDIVDDIDSSLQVLKWERAEKTQ